MKYVDIRFTFEPDQEFLEEEGEVVLELKSITRQAGILSKDEGQIVVEMLAQTDRYWTEYAWKILDEIESGE